jgi:hypothetical protein
MEISGLIMLLKTKQPAECELVLMLLTEILWTNNRKSLENFQLSNGTSSSLVCFFFGVTVLVKYSQVLLIEECGFIFV